MKIIVSKKNLIKHPRDSAPKWFIKGMRKFCYNSRIKTIQLVVRYK